jgi:hypothetical protein
MKIPDFVKSNPFGNIKSIDYTNPYRGSAFNLAPMSVKLHIINMQKKNH